MQKYTYVDSPVQSYIHDTVHNTVDASDQYKHLGKWPTYVTKEIIAVKVRESVLVCEIFSSHGGEQKWYLSYSISRRAVW
jgi:hypothetical protein